MSQYLLSLLILIPLVAATVVMIVPAQWSASARLIAMATSFIQLAVLILLWMTYDIGGLSGFSCTEQVAWFEVILQDNTRFKAEYFVGIDGLGLSMVSLSVIIFLIAALASSGIKEKVKGFFSLILVLNAAIIGCFCALDFLLFFVFFEFMLLPLYFLIGLWGGTNREYASIKFFLYTFLGSIFILVALIVIYLSSQAPDSTGITHSFNLVYLSDPSNIIPSSLLDANSTWTLGPWGARQWLFLLLFVGFGIKLPVVPLHTWLPDAHVEAPTPVSMVLAALVLKVGAYGLIRFVFPLFPAEAIGFSHWIAGLAVLSILYGALNAMASKDLKRLVAYSSVSHMGFVLLGIISMNTEGISGAIYQMFSHGILSAMLFFLAGALSDRTGDRTIDNYSGLSQQLPRYAGFTLIAFVASLGLPGFSGFIGELLVLMGALRSDVPFDTVPQWMAILSALGLILGAAYFLWAYQRMFLGQFFVRLTSAAKINDLTGGEVLVLLPLAIVTLLLGILPFLLLDLLNPFSQSWIHDLILHSTNIH